jgi:hypothetical protein
VYEPLTLGTQESAAPDEVGIAAGSYLVSCLTGCETGRLSAVGEHTSLGVSSPVQPKHVGPYRLT